MARITLHPEGSATPLGVELRTEGDRFNLLAGDDHLEGSFALESDDGVLRIGSRVLRFHAARTKDHLHLWLDGEEYHFDLSPAAEGRHAPGVLPPDGVLTAPMPGRVLKVLVGPGDAVGAGQVLVLLESMKMELTVAAPIAATVAEVYCRSGVMVDLGAQLVRLKADG